MTRTLAVTRPLLPTRVRHDRRNAMTRTASPRRRRGTHAGTTLTPRRQHRLHVGLVGCLALLAGAVAVAQQELPPVRGGTTASTPARRGFTVKVVEPMDGAIAFGPTRLLAAVNTDDPDQVLEVTFWVGDDLVFVDKEAPYQTVYDFGSEARSVVVRAIATHVAGFTVEDAVVTRQLRLDYFVEVRRVRLSLAVTDAKGTPVQGLDASDFEVYEDGKRQSILDFDVETRPLRIALVVDTSGSMRGRLTQVQLAAADFLDVLRPEDRAMVIDFDDQVMLLQPLTDVRSDLRDALMSTFARGGTAMYDAVHATLRRLAPERERKAIVMLSDGGDTASVFSRDKAVEAARTSDVLIYTIGVGGGTDRSALKALSVETGGRAYFVSKADELGPVYEQIAAELRNQYIVTYSSSNPDYNGKWRRIEVRHTGSGNLKVRTRKGYYALQHLDLPLDAPPPTAPASDSLEAPAETLEPATTAAVAAAPRAAGSPTPAPPDAPENPPD